MVCDEPERRRRLWDNQRRFVSNMTAAGFELLSTATPIVPLHVGDEAESERLAAGLRAAGIYVDAIVFPAVGVGQSRLRFMMNAGHTAGDIDAVVDALVRLRQR
jgi:7-keto-8-aminopelargonate synthetase-like enzyme